MTHAFVGLTLARAAQARTGVPARLLLPLAALCAILPDADVLGLPGIELGWGLSHRGVTHSVAFALVLGGVGAYAVKRGVPAARTLTLALLLFVITLSHGLLDAMTNGGPGIAFAAPFSDGRSFLPWRPLEVSPIGVRFFSMRGLAAMASEIVWVWLPVGLVCAAACWRRRGV